MKEQVEKIIREAGAILMQHFGKTVNGRDKTHKGDVESAADHASEQCIVQGIREHFPDDPILAEEHPEAYMRGMKVEEAGKGRLWLVDALDGSRNFLSVVPAFGISIALVEQDQPRFGMVYLPASDELFWAQQGKGAFLNERPAKVSEEKEIDFMRLASFFYSARAVPEQAEQILARTIARNVWRMNLGSAVVDACYVAAGKFEAGLWTGLFQWDIAAAGLILQEAGAKVTDLKGNSWYWGSDLQDIVVANPVLHEKIMRELIQA